MSGQALPRRIEVEDLQPGDKFEYVKPVERLKRDSEGRIVRDADTGDVVWETTSLPRTDVVRLSNRFRSPVPVNFHPNWGGKPQAVVDTRQGENNHGYVALDPKTVVILLERDA